MSMSKKDYKAIAEIIRQERKEEFCTDDIPVQSLLDSLCSYFQQDNPRFDKDTIIVAFYPDNETQ